MTGNAEPGGTVSSRVFSSLPNWPFPPAAPYPKVHQSYAVEGSPSICAGSLADLSASRVAGLRERVEKTGKDLEQWGPIGTAGPCSVPWPDDTTALSAVLGTDGRYHLLRDDNLVCGPQHKQPCSWSTRSDGTYKLHGDPIEEVEIIWDVEPAGELMAPHNVNRIERCPALSYFYQWPPYMGGKSRLARIRRALVNELGTACAICGRTGQKVDHDHCTDLVRGLLCITCNGLVDCCPHVSGCKFQRYLDDPPAAPLRIRYPGSSDTRSSRRARQAQLKDSETSKRQHPTPTRPGVTPGPGRGTADRNR